MKHKKKDQLEEMDVELKSGTSRRAALKKIVVGTSITAGATALPDKWVKPVVDRILVPVHAQTSPSPFVEGDFSGEVDIAIEGKISGKCSKDDNTLSDRFASLLIPKAYAGAKGHNKGQLCISVDKDKNFTAVFQNGSPSVSCQNTIFQTPTPGTVKGGPVKFNPQCNGQDVMIEVTKAGYRGAKYSISGPLVSAGKIPLNNSGEGCTFTTPPPSTTSS